MIKDLLKKIPFFAVIVLFFFLSTSLYRNISRVRRIEGQIEKEKQEIEEAKREGEELRKRLEAATNEVNIEKQIRDKLGLAKDGEIVLVMPSQDVLRSLAPDIEEEEKETLPDPNWKKWAHLFF